MHGGPGKFIYIVLAILLLIDIYAFRGLRHFINGLNDNTRIGLIVAYWLVPAFIAVMTFVIMNKMSSMASGKVFTRTFYLFMGVLILFYVPKLIFSAFELGNDLVNGTIFLINKLNLGINISNINLFRYAGASIAALIFFFTFYGIIHGRYHYKINRLELSYKNLPASFDGFRIVQISDWHIGSYYGRPERIEAAVEKINELNPDLILFTGDLVNNLASEVDEFVPVLKKLKANFGVYSILGNHDYGDYVQWSSMKDRQDNLARLEVLQKEAGFRLLKNESVIISNNGDTIGLTGIENWGLPPFPQYGNLKKAIEGQGNNSFNILMSHDPSHWDAEVQGKTNFDLTLSGHTHGMQFGVIFKNFQWSPVKLKYPRWAGLYSENNQKLYVNVGIGYIGFPGRVGVRPEIAVIKLKKN